MSDPRRQAQRVLSTYAVDLFGMTSALYELGGLCVMHDASGCNSTYTTHDEPRWYDTPSLVVISGLNEIDTIEGNDHRLVDHVVEAAGQVHPAFIAVGGSPMPNAIGTDFRAVARLIEEKTGVPTLGVRTDGIHSYMSGAGDAFRQIAERFVKTPCSEATHGINILGVTPLDFSVVGNATAFRSLCASHHLNLVSMWAMGSTLEEIENAASASVNCLVSAAGLPAAKFMEEKFGIPYVTGIPIGKVQTAAWIQQIHEAASHKHREKLTGGLREGLSSLTSWEPKNLEEGPCRVLLIGEPVIIRSLKEYLVAKRGIAEKDIRLLCPLPDAPLELIEGMEIVPAEQDLREECRRAEHVIADPYYARLLPEEQEKFIFLPHEAFSGRYFRDQAIKFVGEDTSELDNRIIF